MRSAFFVLALASCQPKTASEQAKYAADRKTVMGELDGSLTPIGERGATADGRFETKYDLTVQRVSSGKLCLQGIDRFAINFSSPEKAEAGFAAYARDSRIVLAAYDSQDAIKGWPDKATGVPGRLVESFVKNHPWVNSSNETRDSYYLHFVLEWCAPLPAISATTKYLTATEFANGLEHPSLFIWRITGTPTATSATPAATTDTTPMPPSPAKPSGNSVLEALHEAGAYENFIQIATVAGKEQDLTSGHLILFLSYDNTMQRSDFDALIADKARARAVFDDSVVDGSLTLQELVAKGSVTLTARSGRKLVVTYDAKKQRPFLDGKRLSRRTIEASNGTIYAND
jgi:hypothetical protein